MILACTVGRHIEPRILDSTSFIEVFEVVNELVLIHIRDGENQYFVKRVRLPEKAPTLTCHTAAEYLLISLECFSIPTVFHFID